MFSVYIAHLNNSCEQLQNLVMGRYYEVQQLENIIHELNSLSGMENVVYRLRFIKNEVEQQQQSLLDMLQALMKIVSCYRMAENRICESGEGWRISYKYSYGMEKFNMFENIQGLTPIKIA